MTNARRRVPPTACGSRLPSGDRLAVAVLTQWFEPEPFQLGVAFCRALAEHGAIVRVVTGLPNYPTGAIYPAFRDAAHTVVAADRHVTVERLPLFPAHGRDVVRRLRNYGSFAWQTLRCRSLARMPWDAVLAFHPTPLTWLALRHRVPRVTPIVLVAQDLWPDVAFASGLVPRGGAALLRSLCRSMYRDADAVIAVNTAMRDELVRRGLAPDRAAVVHNWADEVRLATSPTAIDQARATLRSLAGGAAVALFAGNLGIAQGLETLIAAARDTPTVHWVFVGSGAMEAELRDLARHQKSPNVHFLGRVPMEDAGAYLQAADALIVHLRDHPAFHFSFPSKLQAYLFAGRPVIVAANGEAAEIVQAADAGLVLPPDNPAALAGAVLRMCTLPPAERAAFGARARALYHARFSMRCAAGAYLDLIRKAIARRHDAHMGAQGLEPRTSAV